MLRLTWHISIQCPPDIIFHQLMTIYRKIASLYYQDMTCIHDATLIFPAINIPIKMTCLMNQPPFVSMKRPLVEYTMSCTLKLMPQKHVSMACRLSVCHRSCLEMIFQAVKPDCLSDWKLFVQMLFTPLWQLQEKHKLKAILFPSATSANITLLK